MDNGTIAAHPLSVTIMSRTAFAITPPTTQTTDITYDIDVSQICLVTVNHTATTYTVFVNLLNTGITSGAEVYVKRYDNMSNGKVVITSTSGGTTSSSTGGSSSSVVSKFIQNASGKFGLSLYLSTAYGQRSVGLVFRDNWENITDTELDTEAYYINNVKFFGAVGDGVTDDASAIQAAITNALQSADSSQGELARSVDNKEVIVYFPRGTYRIKSTITINGTVVLRGCGGGTYAGSTILQADHNSESAAPFTMLFLGPDGKDGVSNSTLIEHLTFKSAVKQTSGAVAQVQTSTTPNTSAPNYALGNPIQTNSIYIRNCWFKSPQNVAIDLTQGDDIQITGCTFDVAPFSFIRLGSNTFVTNISITNNTFFNCTLDCVTALNVYGATVSNNRAYYVNDVNISPAATVFFNGDSGYIRNVTISANETKKINRIIKVKSAAQSSLTIAVNANVCSEVNDFFIQLVGSGIIYNMAVTGNAVSSLASFSRPAIDDGNSGSGGTAIQNSIISGNTFFSGGTSSKGIQLKGPSTILNVIAGLNAFINFTTPEDI